jgi:hypothetical protein
VCVITVDRQLWYVDPIPCACSCGSNTLCLFLWIQYPVSVPVDPIPCACSCGSNTLLMVCILLLQETELDKGRADRHSLLKGCKVCTCPRYPHSLSPSLPHSLSPSPHSLSPSLPPLSQMEDIRLPFSRGRMEDIGDEDVRVRVW